MKFLSCRDEGSILTDEQDPTEMRALLPTCGPSASEITSTTNQKPVKLRVFSLTELETATGGFGKSSLLGKGSHGCLYKGTLKDGKLVGIKRQENLQDEAAFNNEVEILSTLHSTRFVNLIGFSKGLGAQEKLLVVDFMANGTLHDILQCSGSSSTPAAAAAAAATAEPLGWSMRVQIALQTAKALLSLHSASPSVIHRDVKSSSVHIDGKWNAKLGDFGLALRVHSEDVRRVGAASAPAVGHRNSEDESPSSRISTKVDVFSFGILLLEILSGRNAIDVRFKPPSIIDWALPLIKRGKVHAIYDRRLILLPQQSKALRLMAVIAARCVSRSSVRRPSMSYVVAALQEVSKKLPLAKWAGGLATVMKMTSSCQTPHVIREVRAGPEFCTTNTAMRGPRAASHSGKPRLAVDKPLPSGRAQPLSVQGALGQQYFANQTQPCFIGRSTSIDRLSSIRLSEQTKRLVQAVGVASQGDVYSYLSRKHEGKGEVKEEEELSNQLPRGTTEVSLGGRKIVYNQWRNPMFDVETRSPERALVLPVGFCRSTITHRPGSLSDGAIPMVRLYEEEGRPEVVASQSTTTVATTPRATTTTEEESTCMPNLPLSMSNKVRSTNVRSSSRKSHVKTRDKFEREEAMLPW